eukprot:3637298-Pyramimonas_sp.AAC.1
MVSASVALDLYVDGAPRSAWQAPPIPCHRRGLGPRKGMWDNPWPPTPGAEAPGKLENAGLLLCFCLL